MSNHERETTYSFVAIHTGTKPGQMSMSDEDYSPETVRTFLRESFGPQAQMIAALSNLTTTQISTLNIIFDNVEDMRVQTQADLERMLRFWPGSPEPVIVRRATHDALPEFLKPLSKDLEHLPMLSRIFELYVQLGDNPVDFEQAINRETADMDPHRRDICVMIFQIVLHRILPQIREKIARGN